MKIFNEKNKQLPSFRQLLIFMYLFFVFIPDQHVLLSQGCHDVERTALLTFKSLLEDPSNRLFSWQEGSDSHCCNWHGIKCSNDSLHVISIDLRNRDSESFHNKHSLGLSEPNTSLRGQFSPSLFNIIHLEYIDLGFNNFHESQIPPEISNLKKLIHLDLSNSEFSGLITTQFTNLSFLQYLDISSYFIKSSSLSWVRGLRNLKVLRLSHVDLSEASSSAGNFMEPLLSLSNLSNLDLSHCHLQGSFPYLPQLKELDIGGYHELHVDLSLMFEHKWPKLQHLSILDASVNGSIPSSISSNAPLLASLDLSGNFITGFLPSSIFNLQHLQFLSLSENHLQGPFPELICEASSLLKLDFSGNNFTGTIPGCINKLQNLYYFDISRNSIEGVVSVIDWINKLNLSTLNLNSNRLNVHLDPHLHPSKFILERLELRSCNLKGYIPSFVCNMTHLDTLDLSDNHLSGPFPPCLSKLKNITSINLSRNNLSGTVPYLLEYGNDINEGVLEMNFSHNKFHGPLPLPPQGVNTFDLSVNKFSGEISIETGKRLSYSKYISLSNNELSGSIPSSICSYEHEFRTISSVDLSNNSLSGTIPSSIGYCGNLWNLNLGMNNFTGNVPDELEQIEGLQILQLNDNNLSGTFPDSMKQLNFLEVLNLQGKSFEGIIPSFVGSLLSLKILSLRSNRFQGKIPSGITDLQELQILDLSNNNLSGEMPSCLGNLNMLRSSPRESIKSVEFGGIPDVRLQIVIKGILVQFEHLYTYTSAIDLSSNMLQGNIPEQISQLQGLFMLNLSNNNLSGVIPQSMGNMKSLESLDLRYNKLSGEIPKSLTSTDFLGYLNLSYNNLSCRIPRGNHFDTLNYDGSAFLGNDLLCDSPPAENTCWCGSDYLEDDDKGDAKEKLIFYGMVALGFIFGFWSPFFIMLLKKQKWWFSYWRFIDSIVARIDGF